MARKARTERRDHICDSCDRVFNRHEHLIRHQRIHTHERPFQCHHCNTSFSRRDVLEKHLTRCKPASLSTDLNHDQQQIMQQSRCLRACDRCKRRKGKCDGQYPCGPCQKAVVDCEFTSATTSRRATGHDNAQYTDNTVHSSGALITDQTFFDAPNIQRSNAFTVGFTHPHDLNPGWRISCEASSAPVEVSDSSDMSMMAPAPAENYDGRLPLSQESTTDPPTMYDGAEQTASSEMSFSDWNMVETDFDLTGIFPQMSGLNYETWLRDVDNVLSGALPYQETSTWTSSAIVMMKDYFQWKSLSMSHFTRPIQHNWFSAPPDLQLYDKEMINVLINLAKKHLADSFPIFMPFQHFEGAGEELIIAMAAVGALFCHVEGSQKIAKACYNDARRIVLAKMLSGGDVGFDMLIYRAKTFILLELYGLCSGNARSFEFVEAFHGFLCQIFRRCMYLWSDPQISSARGSEMKLFLEAMQLVEFYRVNILQRPPTLTTYLYISGDLDNQSNERRDQMPTSLSSHFDASFRNTGAKSSFTSLAAIASLVWYTSPDRAIGWRESSLWRTDFIELALHSWKYSQATGIDPGILILYHLAHINVHANVALLQRHALSVARSGFIPSHHEDVSSIEKWLTGQHYVTARWHARSLLETSQSFLGLRNRNLSREKDVPHSLNTRIIPAESPHLSFSVYYASLVLWYGSFAQNQGRSSRNIYIDAGVQILLRLKAHIAKNLSNALYDLLT